MQAFLKNKTNKAVGPLMNSAIEMAKNSGKNTAKAKKCREIKDYAEATERKSAAREKLLLKKKNSSRGKVKNQSV